MEFVDRFNRDAHNAKLFVFCIATNVVISNNHLTNIWLSGKIWWYYDAQFHNTIGPAITHIDGTIKYFVMNKEVTCFEAITYD